MRSKGRVDNIQPETVLKLRQIGATVQVLSSVGNGVPDLLIGYHGITLLLEVKTGAAALTQAEKEWHAKWGGQVAVVRSPEEAQRVVVECVMGRK